MLSEIAAEQLMPRPVEFSPGSFVHTFWPGRVVFGAGTLAQVGDEVAALGVRRVLVVDTRSARAAADAVEQQLGDRFAGRIDGVTQHVPTELANAARATARDLNADAIVAIGGGSAIGLAKAVALTSAGGGVVIVAVPTTYAGSEMTPVWGETAGGSKATGVDSRVLPRVVVYDAALSRGLPVKVTAASVANAMAHCVEAVWTPQADPITEAIAVEGVRALAAGLRAVLVEPEDLDARGKLLYGACLGGSALATAGTGLHHKLCHLLGGTYNLPHAETHAAVLPQVARIKAPTVPQSAARLAAALREDPRNTTDAGDGGLGRELFELFRGAGVAVSLRELGLARGQVDEAVVGFGESVGVGDEVVREILVRAWDGVRP
ncbi:maleylacetate reductase [Kribbella aluminosa]|uniref:Maleylacetate reductase n=1 Tax=Kribbella aluminosa TaxID=416017 RepID=A0ABS4UP92_9ACTN|nr:maleylacetate reductase [Kribbella aluminosa]MBP2353429.1 maleylacetate reductase [Kribbella aluminosa]